MKDQKIRQIIRKQLIKIQENKHLSEKTDWYNIALDIAGFIPGYGEPADFANMVDYAIKGDYLFAAFSAISMVPEVGDVVGKGGKAVVGLSKGFKKGSAIAKKLIGILRSNKGLIDKIFSELEKNEKVPDKFKVHIPKMKSALNLFMQEKFDENINEMEGPEPEAGDIISELEGILETWENKEYASDKDRWQEYAKDIQNLVNRYVDQKEDFYLNAPDTSLQEMAAKLGYIIK